jgi:hypothetical protein
VTSAGIPTGPTVPDWVPPESVDDRLDALESAYLSPLNAAGDNVTDDTAAVAATLTAAGIVGGTVVINRPHRITGQLTLLDNVTLIIQPTGLLDFSTATSGLTCISAAGAVGATVAVNAVAEGATTITGAAGIETGIAAGDWLRLSSADIFDPARTSSPIGELVQVLSTASGLITVRSPIRDTYTTTPVIAKLTTRSGVSITGSGRIIAPAQGIAVRYDCALYCTVAGSRLRFESTGGATAIQLLDCVGCTVEGYDAAGFNNALSGYGTSFVSCTRDCRVRDVRFRDCRHATTTATSAGRPGVPRSNWLEDAHAWDTTGDCFDTHAAADGMHFRDCHSHDAGTSAFNIECPHATVIGCTVSRATAHGIVANNASARPSDYTLEANVIRTTGANGIRYTNVGTSGAGSSQRAVRIIGNELHNTTSEGILVRSTDSWRTGRMTVEGNTVVACQSPTAAIHILKGDGGSVSGNVIEDIVSNGIGLRINDWTYASVIGNTFTFVSLSTGLCIWAPASSGNVTNCVISGNTGRLGNKGIQLDANATANTVVNNDFTGCTTPTVPGVGAGNVFSRNRGGAIATVASASTITLPGSEGDIYKISGTATIDTITATGMAGRTVRLVRTSAAAFSDGVGNLHLSSASAGAADDAITLTSDGTNWFEVGRAAAGAAGAAPRTVTLVASNYATTAEKAGADYICDGVDDQVEINAAIDAIKAATPAAGVAGGTVQLVGPRFNTSNSIILKSYITLLGEGWMMTEIKSQSTWNGAASSGLIKLDDTGGTTPTEYTTLRGLTVHGNKSGQTAVATRGLDYIVNATSGFTYNDSVHTVEYVRVIDTKDDGIRLSGPNVRANRFSNIRVERADLNGFRTDAADSHFHAMDIGGCGLAGYYINGATNHRWTNCKAYFCGGTNATTTTATQRFQSAGWRIEGPRNSFAACEAQDNRGHGFAVSSNHNTLVGCIADSNSWNSTVNADGFGGGLNRGNADGFSISNDTHYVTIEGCWAIDKNESNRGIAQRNGISISTSTPLASDLIVDVVVDLATGGPYSGPATPPPRSRIAVTGRGFSGRGSVTTTNGSTSVTVNSTAQGAFANGDVISANGISGASRIVSGGGTATLTLDIAASASGTATAVSGPVSARGIQMGGSSTTTPGAVTTVAIAHGLGVTPTMFDARPGDTNARGAPAYHVTADATNITLNFASALTGATAYTWIWQAMT